MYKLTGENWVLRLADNARIPTVNSTDEPNTNPHYLAYIDWLAAGGVPEPADPVQLSVEQKLQLNNTAYERATGALTTDYPDMEKDTWPTQDQESAAWLDKPAGAETPWIDRAALERGIDREEYLRRTLVKSRQFKLLSAFLTGRRQRYEGLIKAGQEPELDYELTPEIIAQLQQIALDGMTLPAAELREALG